LSKVLIPFQADEFGQYTWAHRHPKDGWRERYRKNKERLDNRIAEIVEGNPTAPGGKGHYNYRRYGKIDQDAELIAGNDDLVELGAEEGGDSATDNEGGTVQTKRLNAQPQEEEEEEEGHFMAHKPGAIPNPRNQDAESAEEVEEQITEPEPETRPRTRAATRRGGVSPREARTSKRRRTVSPTFTRSRLVSSWVDHSSFRSAQNKLSKNLSPMTPRPYERPR
jgi:hypothetical protein